jgi:hypothetical protein
VTGRYKGFGSGATSILAEKYVTLPAGVSQCSNHANKTAKFVKKLMLAEVEFLCAAWKWLGLESSEDNENRNRVRRQRELKPVQLANRGLKQSPHGYKPRAIRLLNLDVIQISK